MYSTARRLSTISAIFSALNITATVLYLLHLVNAGLGFVMNIIVVLFLVSNAAVGLLLTIALRDLCLDIQADYEDKVKRFKDINNKVKELEHKVK